MLFIRNYHYSTPLLAAFFGLFAQATFGQTGSLALSSASTTAGGTVALNLTLNSIPGSVPAALQWTLTYPAANVASMSVSAGPAVTATGDNLTCNATAGSYMCIASGMNANTIANGVVAVVNVSLNAGAGNTTIAVANILGVSPLGDGIPLTGSAGTITVTQQVPVTLSSVSCSPSTINAPGSANCTVILTGAAPSGGALVTLSDNSTSLTTPASVTVPAGATSAPFIATAGSVSTDQTAAIAASYVTTQSTTVALSAPVLVTSLQCSPSSVQSGGIAACTFGLSKLAPAGGVTVSVSDNNPALTVPSFVSVPAGSISGSFSATAGTVTSSQTVVVTAALNSSAPFASITVSPAPTVTVTSLTCSPTTIGSGSSSTCTVKLSAAAPTGGVTVALSNTCSVLTVPGSVTVPASATSATFLATAGTTPTAQAATITATLNGSVPASLTITPAAGTTCPCSIWPSTALPMTSAASDSKSIEVGLKFRSDVAGYITGVRFYKGTTNTGTHVGHLWSSTGTLLASVTFLNESASGWQQAYFPAPIAVTANTTYVISYRAPQGHYAADMGFFTNSGVNTAPLHALADGQDGPDGLYQYGANVFPNTFSSGTNYWVDVVFNNSPVIGTAAPISLWTPAAAPKVAADSDSSSVELGMKFRSDVPGYITGVRYYKSSTNTGTHVGNLWSNTGALLGTVTFTNETGSGWQQANFAAPIAVNANTTYVISYLCPKGHYAGDNGFFATAGVNTQTLHALVDGQDGSNAVYRYGSSSGYPTSSYQSSNYWVDVVFTATK